MNIASAEPNLGKRDPCWASRVSGCRGKRSLEHYMTRGLWLNGTLTVTGLPWSPEPKEMSIDDLGTRSLCEGHNGDLAFLDQVAIDLNNALRRLDELVEVRGKSGGPHIRPIHLHVNGALFERWALKTAMNLSVVSRSSPAPWRLPEWIPAAIFGKRPLDGGCGLALFVAVGDDGAMRERLQLSLYHLGGAKDPGLLMIQFRGVHKFGLTWDVPMRTVALQVAGKEYLGGEALFPLRELNFNHRRRPLRLALIVDSQPTARADPAVVALRARYKSPPRSR